MSISNFTMTLAHARSAIGNGRGVDNHAAKACRELGYTVVAASESNKFVEVHGAAGATLVAFYASWGGYQVEVGSAALAVELSTALKAPLAPKSNGRRVALGHGEEALAAALKLITGGPVEEKGQAVQAPIAALQAPVVEVPVVEAPKAPALDVTAIVTAALAAGKSQAELLELIAALKA